MIGLHWIVLVSTSPFSLNVFSTDKTYRIH